MASTEAARLDYNADEIVDEGDTRGSTPIPLRPTPEPEDTIQGHTDLSADERLAMAMPFTEEEQREIDAEFAREDSVEFVRDKYFAVNTDSVLRQSSTSSGFHASKTSTPSHIAPGYQTSPQTSKKRKYEVPIGLGCKHVSQPIDDSDGHDIWRGIKSPLRHIVEIRGNLGDSLHPEVDIIYCQAGTEYYKVMKGLQKDDIQHLALPCDTNTAALPKYLLNFKSLKTLTFVCGEENQDLIEKDFYLINCELRNYLSAQKATLLRQRVGEAFQEMVREPILMCKRIEMLVGTPCIKNFNTFDLVSVITH